MKEYLDIVNENDILIGKASREECHKNKTLIHRGTNIYIFKSDKLDYILRVKRSAHVDTEAGKWTIVVGEHNKIGEDYDSSAKRCLKEELGIKGINIIKISKVLRRMKNQTEIHQNYIAIYEGNINEFTLNTDELVKAEFIKLDKLKKDIKRNKAKYFSYIESALEEIVKYKTNRKNF